MAVDSLAREPGQEPVSCVSRTHLGPRAIPNLRRNALRAKRFFDFVFASLIIAFLSIPMIMIAIAIKLESKGPALFCQRRWGRNRQSFVVFKYRTMLDQTPDPHKEYETLRSDPRITRIGSFLRKSSLDELPQLLNVLLGTMSIVGPRPLVEWESMKAETTHPERFLMRPGLTGLAQVSGRNSLNWFARLDKDVEYVRKWSLWLDLKIVLQTPLSLLDTGSVYPQD